MKVEIALDSLAEFDIFHTALAKVPPINRIRLGNTLNARTYEQLKGSGSNLVVLEN